MIFELRFMDNAKLYTDSPQQLYNKINSPDT